MKIIGVVQLIDFLLKVTVIIFIILSVLTLYASYLKHKEGIKLNFLIIVFNAVTLGMLIGSSAPLFFR